MPNNNGELIFVWLQQMDRPVTMRDLVAMLAEASGVRPNVLKRDVMDTLNQGVRHGFIRRSRGRYYVGPIPETAQDAIKTSVMKFNLGQIKFRRNR